MSVSFNPVVSAVPQHASQKSFSRAIGDIRAALGRRELWLHLGWQDIKQRYRRSVLGPLWITIAAAVSSVAMGLLYAGLFHKPMADFLPHVAVGFVFWSLIQGALVDGTEVFIENEGLIKQLPAPISVHVLRLVWRQLLFLMHNVIIIVVVLAVFPKQWSWADLSFIPAIVLIAVNAFWIALVIGTLATRFRDIAPLMTSLVQVIFFLTPIIWSPDSIDALHDWRGKIIQLNPVYHFLDIVRTPLLGKPQQLYHWIVVAAITVIGWAITLVVMRNYRSRIPYWV